MPEEAYTDLIDVSDVASVLDDERIEIESPSENIKPSAGDFSIATLQERFSAFFIDLTVLYLFYSISLLIYCYTFIEVPPFLMPLLSKQVLIFHGIVILIFLLYFLICEMFFGVTIGKSICRLSIRMTDGRPAGKLASLIRTILRPVDVILLPINMFVIEKTSWSQKIGDILSRTVVIKYLKQRRKSYNPGSNNLASAGGRLIAFLIDFSLLAFFVVGLLMQLNNDQPLFSLTIVLLTPLLVFYGISFVESFFGTTPGKWIFGYIICKEDGTKTEWTQSIIRTLFRIYDNNPIGFLCIYLSSSKQRPGDISAGTVVIKQRREIKGLICLLLFSGICILSGYIGMHNPDSILIEKKVPNFLIRYRLSSQALLAQMPKRLSVVDLKYAVGNSTATRTSPYFNAGEKIFISFLVDGYAISGNNPWLSQDLTIKYPDGSNAIQLENLVEFKSELTTTGPIMMENNFELPSNSPAGRYTLVLTINDKLKNNTLKRHFFFYVKETGSPPSKPMGEKELPPDKANYIDSANDISEESKPSSPSEPENSEQETIDSTPKYHREENLEEENESDEENELNEDEDVSPNLNENDETSGT